MTGPTAVVLLSYDPVHHTETGAKISLKADETLAGFPAARKRLAVNVKFPWRSTLRVWVRNEFC